MSVSAGAAGTFCGAGGKLAVSVVSFSGTAELDVPPETLGTSASFAAGSASGAGFPTPQSASSKSVKLFGVAAGFVFAGSVGAGCLVMELISCMLGDGHFINLTLFGNVDDLPPL